MQLLPQEKESCAPLPPVDFTSHGSRTAQVNNVCGPYFIDGKEVLLCRRCDADHPSVSADYPDGVPTDAQCVLEELLDLTVTVTNQGASLSWQLLVDNPYPPADFPNANNSQRRFVTYKAAAIPLGAAGTRMVLPECGTADAEPVPTLGTRPAAGRISWQFHVV